MKFDVLTLHPEMIRGPLGTSMMGRAQEAGLVQIGVHDIRDWSTNKHRTVDDTPYGGGPGMVMRVDVVAAAIEAVRTDHSLVVLTSRDKIPKVFMAAMGVFEEFLSDARLDALGPEEFTALLRGRGADGVGGPEPGPDALAALLDQTDAGGGRV